MEERDAALKLTELINGFQVSQIIHTAAILGIPDMLKEGAKPSDEVATATRAHPGAMYRLLHALASAGILEEQIGGLFCLTALGQCLRSDARHSRAAWARNIGRPYAWAAWGDMLQCVRTGQDSFRRLQGKSVWQWRAGNPVETAFFDAAMTELSRGVADAIADSLDFSQFRCIMDVGGGQGEFLAGILNRNPQTRGILFDLPHVVAGAPSVLSAHGVADRCDIVGGSMSVSVPGGGDACILKNVFLDEEDDQVCGILKICREVMPASGHLFVIEPLATEPNKPEPSLLDMTMLVMTGGRKRKPEEYHALSARAGFKAEQAVANRSALQILNAVPA
jgi:O-methyltransferase domain/Dimerisation domain